MSRITENDLAGTLPDIDYEQIFIPSRISYNQFGSSEQVFHSQIKNQPLTVIGKSDDGQFLEVEDPTGEKWTVHVSDLMTDHDYRAMKHQEFQDWRKKAISEEDKAKLVAAGLEHLIYRLTT